MQNARDYRRLVEDERVHGSLFWDPNVFADEIERLWSRIWVYVGHESEVPTPGTFARKKLGLQPVVLTRAADGTVHVLFNRCAHSANLVCHEERGAASSFRCPFHGWTYGLDGRNVGVPFPEGYGPDFDRKAYSLAKPARVDSYRGFVFASQSVSGPSLREYLGPAGACLDAVCDLSPDGELDLTAGWLRHQTYGNWKLGYEAALDGYHPKFVHRGLISLMEGSDSIFEQTDDSAAEMRSFPNGHGDVNWAPHYREADRELRWIGTTRDKLPAYVAALEAARGEQRAHELLVEGPPHVMICPNLFIAELFVMVLDPISPTSHVQLETPLLWKGGRELNERNLVRTGASIGPAGMVLADDCAMIERNQRGLESGQPEWMLRKRGVHRTRTLPDGTRTAKLSDDTGLIGFWSYYRSLMTAASPA